jgi:pimeloyl-ACP methyl ester carboxylesterase
VATTPTKPHQTSPGTPQLAPRFDGYGPEGRSEWLDVDWRQHLKSVAVNGTRVNYVEMGAGPPLVFVHGLAGCWQNWLENIPHFARTHRVVAVDLPGFGESELPNEDISIPGYGRFVDAFLGAVGVERGAIVGNSMGGFISAEVALNHPGRVEKLVLVSAAGLVTVTPGRLSLAKRVAPYFHLVGARTVGRREHFMYGVATHPDLLQPELCFEIASGAGKDGFLDAFAAVLDYDFRDRLSDVEVPTLNVWGRQDKIVPVGGAHEYERLIAGSRKEIFEDTGHVPMIERPHRFNALLEEFLAA